jgi:hypothetical protein
MAQRDEQFRRETDPAYRAFAARKDAEEAAVAAANAARLRTRNIRALLVLLGFMALLGMIIASA